MFTQLEKDYRIEHGVVPYVDFINHPNCLEMLPKSGPVHSRFAKPSSMANKVRGGEVIKGIGHAMMAVVALGAGEMGYAAGKLGQGIGGVIGSVKVEQISVETQMTELIIEKEKQVWDLYQFVKHFEPAAGNLGDIYYRDGSCDDFHTGNGYRIFENGDYFEGKWEDGETARGLYIWASGERFLGYFQDNVMQGFSLHVFPDGSYYYGDMSNGVRHGYGVMWYKDGVYVGHWNNDLRHGAGGLRVDSGVSFIGEFRNDSPVE